MRLASDEAHARLAGHVHGVLASLHPERGPDLHPVMYGVVDSGHVGVPIDQVKPKRAPRLQREVNLLGDPRAALLVERWDADDWSRLWWVRADLEHMADPPPDVVEAVAARLASTIAQYADRPFHRVLVFRIVQVAGWAANAGEHRTDHGGEDS